MNGTGTHKHLIKPNGHIYRTKNHHVPIPRSLQADAVPKKGWSDEQNLHCYELRTDEDKYSYDRSNKLGIRMNMKQGMSWSTQVYRRKEVNRILQLHLKFTPQQNVSWFTKVGKTSTNKWNENRRRKNFFGAIYNENDEYL